MVASGPRVAPFQGASSAASPLSSVRAPAVDHCRDTDHGGGPDPRMSQDAFARYVAQVRAQVDAWLQPWLAAGVAAASRRGAAVEAGAVAGRGLVARRGQ